MATPKSYLPYKQIQARKGKSLSSGKKRDDYSQVQQHRDNKISQIWKQDYRA